MHFLFQKCTLDPVLFYKITVVLLTEGNVSSQEIRMCNNLVVGRSCSDLNGCEQDLSVQETQ
jgi:hypothetical protein